MYRSYESGAFVGERVLPNGLALMTRVHHDATFKTRGAEAELRRGPCGRRFSRVGLRRSGRRDSRPSAPAPGESGTDRPCRP
ncbi:hypothetical protein AAW14_35165 [Streptomyces hygroscopicus]|nr:hypothetical protein [Streptomyces hygroscopicus]